MLNYISPYTKLAETNSNLKWTRNRKQSVSDRSWRCEDMSKSRYSEWVPRRNQHIPVHGKQGGLGEALVQKNEWTSGVAFENQGRKNNRWHFKTAELSHGNIISTCWITLSWTFVFRFIVYKYFFTVWYIVHKLLSAPFHSKETFHSIGNSASHIVISSCLLFVINVLVLISNLELCSSSSFLENRSLADWISAFFILFFFLCLCDWISGE